MSNTNTVERLQEAIAITEKVIREMLEVNDFTLLVTPVVVWNKLQNQEVKEEVFEAVDSIVKPLLGKASSSDFKWNIEIKENDDRDLETLNILKTLNQASELLWEYVFEKKSYKAVTVAGIAHLLTMYYHELLPKDSTTALLIKERMQKIDTLYQLEKTRENQ